MEELRTYPEGSEHPGPIGRATAESRAAWPVPPAPPPDAPNVALIVLDDLGFAQLGCFGGLGGRIRTPHLDRLAASGLRFRNFHTTALCSPTRAALLTGRNHHSVGMATIAERATGFPGYHGRIPRDTAMLPAVLVEHGYATMAIGKWHLTPDEHVSPAGPFDRFPLGQGFERFYGFMGGETSQWEPDLWEDNHPTDAPGRPEDGYHLSADLVDRTIGWITGVKAVAPSKPFFGYLAFGTPHSPHHAPVEDIEPYRGVFDDGWDVIREQALAAQVELGVVAPGTVLPLRNPGVRAWAELSDDRRRLYARQMEVYAGVVTHTDAQIGRLLDFLDEAGLTDDTVVMVLSDNGASAEGGPDGRSNALGWFNGVPESVAEMLEQADGWGSPDTHPHYASGWAMAGNTPNRLYKAFVHEGGTRDPLLVSWPGHVPDPGAVRGQFHHVVDVVPTIMELLGLSWPASVRGHDQRPLEGTSFAYTLTDGDSPTRKTCQYFEMFAHRAIWADGWKAVALHWSRAVLQRLGHIDHELHDGDHDADRWELYHLDHDMSEMDDLAGAHPDKLAELVDLWWEEAERHRVLPLDDTLLERLLAPRPHVFEERDVYTYAAPVRLPRQGSPTVRDRSYRITADVDLDEGGEGVVVSYGGSTGGFSLCVLDGRVHFVSNFLGRAHTVASSHPVDTGRHVLEVRFARTAPNAGRVTLLVDGDAHDEVDVPRTNPVVFSSTEGLEVGTDSVSPVWPRYRSPFPFTGGIHRVVVATRPPDGPPPPEVAEAEARLAMHRQ